MRTPVHARGRLGIVVALMLLIGLLGAPPAQAAPPKIIAGWLPYWMTSPTRPAGVNSAVANADVISEVSPFWYSSMKNGSSGVSVKVNPNFTTASTSIPWALGQLRGAGLRIIPAIADSSGKGVMAATLADPAKRAAHIADIVNLVTSNNYDGIDLDYEIFAFSDGRSTWEATRPNWTAFVTELAAALHAQGKVLSVTIPPQCDTKLACGPKDGYWVYDIGGIAPVVDRLRIMAYDYHVQGIGAIAPMEWVRGLATNAAQTAGAGKVFIGVPTYGRSWTLKTSNRYRLNGGCPAEGTSEYRTLTAMVSVTDADIPGTLAKLGVDPASVQWDPVAQESWVEYDKNLTWTDGSGATQTCTARRIMWWVGPQAVLARTQLVGELGLGGAALWTIGGDDPAQWPLIRSYAQTLVPGAPAPAPTGSAPASGPPTVIAQASAARVIAGSALTVTATATASGTPIAGSTATLQFQPSGADWASTASAPTNATGAVAFTVTPTASGSWRVLIPAAGAVPELVSDPLAVEVAAAVTAKPRKTVLGPLKTTKVRVTARPAVPGQVILIQRKTGSTWKVVATGTTDGAGIASVPVRVIKKRGSYTYRAVAQRAGTVTESVSPTFRIRVR